MTLFDNIRRASFVLSRSASCLIEVSTACPLPPFAHPPRSDIAKEGFDMPGATRAGKVGDKVMQKGLTLMIDEEVYDGLRQVVGPRRISQFVEDLVRPHVVGRDMRDEYRAMAADRRREAEALAWAEATCGDVSHRRI